MRLRELTIDNTHGKGAVPYNADVEYFGMRVKVKPLVFLKIAAHVDFTGSKGLDGLKKHLATGGAFGAPFLNIVIPDEWFKMDYRKLATIRGHEGRHRMQAIYETEGNIPVETHLFLIAPSHEIRARHIKPEWKNKLNDSIVTERGLELKGPWFE